MDLIAFMLFYRNVANTNLTKQTQRRRRNGAAAAQAADVTARSRSLQRMVILLGVDSI